MVESVRKIEGLDEWVRRLAKASGKPAIVKTIPFTNDDVPRYLEKYHEFLIFSSKVDIGPIGYSL